MFHYGIVEDNKDPQQLGRARVRVFGIHSFDKADIPTNTLPWASTVQPTTSSANSGIGQTPRLVNGTLVMLSFADPDEMQFPIIIGTLPAEIKESLMRVEGVEVPRHKGHGFQDPDGKYPKTDYVGENDLPKLSREDNTEHPRTSKSFSVDGSSISEPSDLRGKSTYPNNQVRQSESGHFEEWDDTPGNERINQQHKSGSFTETRPDGTVVNKIVGDNFTIINKGNKVFVGGDVQIFVTGNTTLDCSSVKMTGNLTVNGEVRVDGGVTVGKDVITDQGVSHNNHTHIDSLGLGSGSTTTPI